jgi:acyl-CoA-binding protein
MIEQFEQAVKESKSLTERPNNEMLLNLYSLYKQATEGDNTTEAPTNIFDFVAKAKHSAWEALKGTTKENAMQQYIDLVKKIKG